MLLKLPLLYANLGPKGVVAVGAALSGVVSAAAVEVSGIAQGQSAALACVIAAASLLGGFIAALPSIIRAKSESKKTEMNMADEAMENLLARIYDSQNQERDSWNRQQIFMQDKLNKQGLSLSLARTSKHKLLSECQRLMFHVEHLQTLLRDKGADLPAFTPMTFNDLLRHEDEMGETIETLSANRVP